MDKALRIVATGFCFVYFGTGGFLLWLVVFPLLSLILRNPHRRSLVARLVVHHSFRVFVGLMRWVRVLDYEIIGREKLNRDGLLILANHPSLIDVIFLISLVRNADCIVKASLAQNLFTRGPVRSSNYVCNNSGPELIFDCIESVRSHGSLIVFPEGTRSVAGKPIKLQRGAANIAVRGRLDMTPVLIRVSPPTLAKGEKWYRVPPRRVFVSIEVLDDIPISNFLCPETSEAVAARRLTEYLTDFFTRKLRFEDAARRNQEADHRHALPRSGEA